MVDPRHEGELSRRRAWEHRIGRSAADVARLAAAVGATAARLAAQRRSSAQVLPEHADELLRRARDAEAFAERERREAQRWARMAEELLPTRDR